MSSSLKILKTEIVNFKNLSHKEVDIQGRSIMIVGANDKGKSSFIQAVLSAFNPLYKPLVPIKEGEERGSVVTTFGGNLEGEEVEYTVDIRFSPEHQKGRIRMYNPEGGEIKNAKAVLESMIGDISFDIDRFLEQAKTISGKHSKDGVKRQIEMLKSFLPIDVQKQLEQCEVDRLEIYGQRTDLNKEISILEGQNTHDLTDEVLEKYSEPIDMTDISTRMKDVGTAHDNWNKINSGVSEIKNFIDKAELVINTKETFTHNREVVTNCIDSIENKLDQKNSIFLVHCRNFLSAQNDEISIIEETELKLVESKEKLAKGEAWLLKNPTKPSMDGLIEEQTIAQEHNSMATKVAEMRDRYNIIKEKKVESAGMTERINALQKKKKQIFIDHPLPVKDLSFTEDEVLYKGLPFNDTQHPSSTIISVGIAIAMAKNPNLKIVVIKDGSLLDKNLYNKILSMVEKKGFQLFIEVVDWEANDMEVKFAERFE